MKGVLIDENLPPALVTVYEGAGVNAMHVYDLELTGDSDRAIWARALLDQVAIATKDSDFADLATVRREGQVILFKVGNMRIRETVLFAVSR